MYHNTKERAKGPLLALALLGGCVLALAPISEPQAVGSEPSLTEKLANLGGDLLDSWRGFAGPLEGDSYELYATLGSGDPETMRRYYAQQGSEELDRVFSYR